MKIMFTNEAIPLQKDLKGVSFHFVETLVCQESIENKEKKQDTELYVTGKRKADETDQEGLPLAKKKSLTKGKRDIV